jgi:hypothetical protein
MTSDDKIFLVAFVVTLLVLGLHVAAWVFLFWLFLLLTRRP